MSSLHLIFFYLLSDICHLLYIIKTFKLVNQIFSSFSKSYLSSDFNKKFKLFSHKKWTIFNQFRKNNRFFFIKICKYFNSRKIISTRKKIYYQYTLIEPFVQNYIKTFSENIIKFTDYLNSKISYYDTAFLQFNNTITSIYNELSNDINDKYQITDKTKLSAVMSLYYELLHQNITVEVKLTSFLAISFGFDFSVSFGLDVGMEGSSIFIDAYGEASLTISGEVYLFLGQKPVEVKVGIGISLLLGSVRAGC